MRKVGLPNASIGPQALSSDDGVFDYFVPLSNGARVSALGSFKRSVLEGQEHLTAVSVRKSTGDSLRGSRISLIKIDVEGHELEVLRGKPR